MAKKRAKQDELPGMPPEPPPLWPPVVSDEGVEYPINEVEVNFTGNRTLMREFAVDRAFAEHLGVLGSVNIAARGRIVLRGHKPGKSGAGLAGKVTVQLGYIELVLPPAPDLETPYWENVYRSHEVHDGVAWYAQEWPTRSPLTKFAEEELPRPLSLHEIRRLCDSITREPGDILAFAEWAALQLEDE